MTKEELLEKLLALVEDEPRRYDPERDHEEADELLLAFIDDPNVTEAFERIDKWYA